MTNSDAQSFQEQLGRIEELIQQLENVPDPEVQNMTRVLVQSILELHSGGLTAMLEAIHENSRSGQDLIDSLAEDELVSHLLLLHGLHPLDVHTRVEQALDKTSSFLRENGISAKEIRISAEGVVHLRVHAENMIYSSSMVREELERTIFAYAPDVATVEIQGLKEDEDSRLSLPLLNQPVGH